MNIKSFSFPKNRSSNDHIIMETEIPVTFRWKLEFQSFLDENSIKLEFYIILWMKSGILVIFG